MYGTIENMRIFTGTANPKLAENISKYLHMPMGSIQIKKFSDGESFVKIEENIRNRDVFLIQPTCPPVNDHLMELLIMVDAAKRASAGSITAVIPYYGYARQDRKADARTPISAKLVADLITAAGVTRVVSIDLHANQIQGFFNVPVDNLYGAVVLLRYLKESLWRETYDPGRGRSNMVIVTPDVGGAERARFFAKHLDAKMAIVDKSRPEANVSQVMNVIGKVEGKDAVLVDDMVDTAGSLCKAAEEIMKRGARRVWAAASHPVFSGEAIKRITDSPIEKLIVTDTIPMSDEAKACEKIVTVSVAELLSEAMRRLLTTESLSELFLDEL